MSNQKEIEKDFIDYAIDEYSGEPSKNSMVEFFEQSKQVPMQAIGMAGNIAKSLHEASKKAFLEQQGMPFAPEFEGQRYVIPETPLPTSEDIGKKVGYQEPTTMGGRIGKSVFSGVGAAIPLTAATAMGHPEAVLPSLASAAAGGLTSQAAREMGAPEPVASAVDIGTQLAGGRLALGKSAQKPSGIASRRFEDLAKPTKISPERYRTIKNAIEEESKDIVEKNFSKNPTYTEIKQTPASFFSKLDNDFARVENLSNVIPLRTNGDRLGKSLLKRFGEKKFSPITVGEEGKKYKEMVGSIFGEIDPEKKFSLSDLVRQYRDNNKELAGAFEATKSTASNEGKKNALLDWNRAIADEIHRLAPESDFNKLFQSTNKRYSDLMNVEKIDSFLDEVFSKDKINYGAVKEYFKGKRTRASIRQTFGADSEKQFSLLMKDLLSQEKGMGKLRVSEPLKFEALSPISWSKKAKQILTGKEALGFSKTEKGLAKKILPGIIGTQTKKTEREKKTIDDLLSEKD